VRNRVRIFWGDTESMSPGGLWVPQLIRNLWRFSQSSQPCFSLVTRSYDVWDTSLYI